MEAVFEGAGVTARAGDSLPDDFTEEYGVLVLLNPLDELPDDVLQAAEDVVAGGGRLVSQTEASSAGGHEQANRALEAAGSWMRSISATSGEALEIGSVPPLTDGVDTIAPFHAARVELGPEGISLARVSPDYVVIGYEVIGGGDVVVVADGAIFGDRIEQADNAQLVRNLAKLRYPRP